jgi:hypothetical protein
MFAPSNAAPMQMDYSILEMQNIPPPLSHSRLRLFLITSTLVADKVNRKEYLIQLVVERFFAQADAGSPGHSC